MRLLVDGLEGDEAIGKAQATVGNCVVAAVLLKTWFRELPDSVVPQVVCFLPPLHLRLALPFFSEALRSVCRVGLQTWNQQGRRFATAPILTTRQPLYLESAGTILA